MDIPETQKTPHLIFRSVSVLWAGILGAVLISYACVGYFSRYIFDDFQTAAYLRTKGFWQSQRYWYQAWSGRFSFFFTIDLLHISFGPKIVPFLPALALLVWWLALGVLIFQVTRLNHQETSMRPQLLLSALIVAVTFAINGNLPDVAYWETGIVTYTLPIALFCMVVSWMIHCVRRDKRVSLLTSFPVGIGTTVVSGYSETMAAFQATFFAIALFFVLLKFFKVARDARRLFVAGFLGSIVALVIVATSPGNPVRMEGQPYAATPWVAKAAFLYTFYLVFKFLFFTPLAAAMTFILPSCVTLQVSPPLPPSTDRPHIVWANVRKLLLMNLAVMVAITACTVPGFYAFGSTPPPRALMLPQFLMVGTAAWWGYLVASALRPSLSATPLIRALAILLVTPILVIQPLRTLKANIQALQVATHYAREWDAQDQEIRNSQKKGMIDLKVHVIPKGANGYCRLSSDPQDWYNKAVAEYYGLNSIAALDSRPNSCD
jgi:hypothetical protein